MSGGGVPGPAGSAAARLGVALGVAALIGMALGFAAGGEGWSWRWQDDWALIASIRAPRTLGAFAAGALLGLAGALAQGLFRNPLADPYLLGSASGASLGVVGVVFAGSLAGASLGLDRMSWLLQIGLVGAAFVGAVVGVSLTLVLAGGAARPLVLLLAGVVIGVLLAAVADVLVLLSPEALRAKQAFLLGTTSLLGWPSVTVLVATLTVCLPLAVRFGVVLDALVLGDATALSLGVRLSALRAVLVAVMALCTGAAVAQAGLIAFVGLVAPHLVRRLVTVTHRHLLALSALAGGVLLVAADVAARSLIAPQELPVGVLTAVFGGVYLLMLLRRQAGLGRS